MSSRRDFVTLLGGAAAAWPLAARAQQPVMPVIGVLASGSAGAYALRLSALRQGLAEVGYVEGQNVAVEYRWADERYDRLPKMAAEFADRRVAVIVALGGAAAVPAKAATATVPIVFVTGGDPVKSGLVTNLSRPDRNLTGASVYSSGLVLKKLELLREIVPGGAAIGMLLNSNDPNAAVDASSGEEAARALGLRLHILQGSTEPEIHAAFTALVRQRMTALMIQPDATLASRRVQLVVLTARHAIPAIDSQREFVAAGGLLSYGSPLREIYRQAGIYAGRVLKGAKPADLPVLLPSKFELAVNLTTAQAIGITIPTAVLLRADEVIE